MCTQCILKIPDDPGAKCTIGSRGSQCKECLKRKHPDDNDNKPTPPCIQFDVAKYPRCWGAISALREQLRQPPGHAPPPPQPPQPDVQQRLRDHCELLVEFATVTAKDHVRHAAQSRAHRADKEELKSHLDHVRAEVEHLNIEKNKTARQHKNEVARLRETVACMEARVSQMGAAIRAAAGQGELVARSVAAAVKGLKNVKVADSEVKEQYDID
jgi:hypothetical protein